MTQNNTERPSPLSPPPHENFPGGEPPLTESPTPEVFVAGPPEGGKGGEGGIFQASNADFVAALFFCRSRRCFPCNLLEEGRSDSWWVVRRPRSRCCNPLPCDAEQLPQLLQLHRE